MAKLLVVEDDADLARVVSRWLAVEGHTVDIAKDLTEARHFIETSEYELIILDRALPDGEGADLVKRFRAEGNPTPVLFLTGKRSIEERVEGLESGGDDYLTKPFHGKELMARVQALLRRPVKIASPSVKIGRLELVPERRSIKVDGNEVALVSREYALLEFLLKHPRELFPADRLLNQVWSDDSSVGVEALSSCIKRLRKKIDVDGSESFIKNVYGVGYGIFPQGEV
ncbi:MAG: response regulator transcription factor [Candidatus Obscuribacterales bacterium]|nr:response regulator transcription factor [Candidatus Obscuribacterales bacterium]